jgi:hypothetical protein
MGQGSAVVLFDASGFEVLDVEDDGREVVISGTTR